MQYCSRFTWRSRTIAVLSTSALICDCLMHMQEQLASLQQRLAATKATADLQLSSSTSSSNNSDSDSNAAVWSILSMAEFSMTSADKRFTAASVTASDVTAESVTPLSLELRADLDEALRLVTEAELTVNAAVDEQKARKPLTKPLAQPLEKPLAQPLGADASPETVADEAAEHETHREALSVALQWYAGLKVSACSCPKCILISNSVSC
jgi:hypothetical protein